MSGRIRFFTKSQITFFLIVVSLLLTAGIIIYTLPEEDPNAKILANLPDFARPVHIWVDECIQNAAVQATYQFGIEQGISGTPLVLETGMREIAYYYIGRDIIPTNSIFERQLSLFMDQEVSRSCSNFSFFEQRGYSMEFQEPETSATILENELFFDVQYPVIIKKDQSITFDRFSYQLPFRVGHVLNVSRKLVDAIEREPEALDLTLLADQDIDISVHQFDACNQLYVLVDNESRISGQDDPYLQSFAVRFSDEYCLPSEDFSEITVSIPESGNYDPAIDPVLDLLAYVGEEFVYTLDGVDPDGDTIFYHASGILKEHIHILDGEIRLTPTADMIGEHSITISAIDLKGGLDEQSFTFTVE